ncbi:MAG TPA: dihydropteroate synthase [Candidatus Avidesulfovibrio excrementigallinarum]|nr:dihydropteroate synthase [Candidatus Avidesulfovibrio excrementigallinarum]
MSERTAWTVLGGRVIQPAPFCIAGILNLTPDSFSDGTGALPPLEKQLARAFAMLDELDAAGCGMLDLGAESTRPGSAPVPEDEELRRLMPVLHAVKARRPDALVSVDTCRAAVAAAALDAGAQIVNDVSACCRDAALTDVLAGRQPGYVLTHGGKEHFAGLMRMQPAAGVAPVVQLVRFFERELNRLVRAGLKEDRIVLDPGIGFGKTGEENWQILRDIEQLNTLGRPLYLGLSRKSLFGWLLDLPAGKRDTATQVVTALMAARGVPYHRVHDVTATARTLRMVGSCTPSPAAVPRNA